MQPVSHVCAPFAAADTITWCSQAFAVRYIFCIFFFFPVMLPSRFRSFPIDTSIEGFLLCKLLLLLQSLPRIWLHPQILFYGLLFWSYLLKRLCCFLWCLVTPPAFRSCFVEVAQQMIFSIFLAVALIIFPLAILAFKIIWCFMIHLIFIFYSSFLPLQELKNTLFLK